MNNKTKEQLLKENASLHLRIAELEKTENNWRRYEAKLKESEKKYKTLIETSTDMIFTVDVQGNFLFTNKAFKQRLGYSVEEIKKINGFELVHPEDLVHVQKQFAQLLEGKSVDNLEYRYKTKDGSYIYILNNSSPILNSQGKTIELFGVATDISHQKRIELELQKAQEELELQVKKRTAELEKANKELKREIEVRCQSEQILKESEEKFRDLADQSPNMIFINKKGRVVYTNKKCEEMMGYTREEFHAPEFNFRTIIAPESQEVIKKSYEIHSQGKDVPPYEYKLVDKKGEKIDAIITSKLINYEGDKAILGIVTDISKLKQIEGLLKKSLHEKEILLREIHHRVKNNMQIVSSLLRIQSQYLKNEQALEAFRASQNRIRSIALIHESLYRSKNFAEIDFRRYISTLAVHLFHAYETDSSLIRLKTDLENIFLDINKAIPCGLIINELLTNSLEHAFPEGEKGEIFINFKAENGRYLLILGDTGIGLPADFDIKHTDSIGLQIVNDLVRQIGGTIKVEKNGKTKWIIEF